MGENRLKTALRWLESALLGRVTLPAWIAIAMAIFLGVPAWSDAIRYWLETAKTTPTWAADIVPVIVSPYFPGALAVFGVVYLFVVGYEGTDIIRHKVVPVVGWIVVGLCFISVSVTALYGATELYIRSEIAKGIAGIPRNSSPAENTPLRPQRPLSYADSQILQPDQIRIPKIQNMLQEMTVYSAPGDVGPKVEYAPFDMIFARSGVRPGFSYMPPRSTEDQGLILFVQDLKNAPASAQKFAEILTMADVKYAMRTGENIPGVSGSHWALYFGPIPFD